jgi:hypothetical protein
MSLASGFSDHGQTVIRKGLDLDDDQNTEPPWMIGEATI